jgi:uncharacterized protein (TIGR00251 family)
VAGPKSSPEPDTIAPADPFAAEGDHVLLAVRITPKASRNAVGAVLTLPDGRHALAVRIAAPPVDGAANAELVAFLAKALGIARGDVTIAAGETGRLKRVRIRGDVSVVVGRLRAAITPA